MRVLLTRITLRSIRATDRS